MKKTAFLFILAVAFVTGLKAESHPSALFDQGNEAYKNASYDTALALYLQADSAGYTSWQLHYNIGNAYFKTGQIPFAILHYEKSLKLSPGNKDVIHNLKFAEQSTVDDITAMPKLFYEDFFNRLINAFSSYTWFIIAALFFVVLCASVVLFLTNFNGLKALGYYIFPVALFLFVITFAVAYVADYRLQTQNEGVIIESTVRVKSEPSATSKTLFVIHGGLKVEIRTTTDDMHEIQIPDGRVGWIEKQKLEKI